jgi:5-methylcytosine-specific restriction endonuclease McrA
MKQKYKAKAKASFRTKLNLYIFKCVIENEVSQISLDNFNGFEIDQAIVDKYTRVYWQQEVDKTIEGKSIKDIERDISHWKKDHTNLIEEFEKHYVEVMFPTIFPFNKFEELIKVCECNYCTITKDDIADLGKRGKFKKKSLRGWTLEIDRFDSNFEYKPDNTVMACYWCNNAKTDEFDEMEFKIIGRAIKEIWKNRMKPD